MASHEITYPPLYATPGGLKAIENAGFAAVSFDPEQFSAFNEALGPVAPPTWGQYPVILAGYNQLCTRRQQHWHSETINPGTLKVVSDGTPAPKLSVWSQRVSRTTLDNITKGAPDVTSALTQQAINRYVQEHAGVISAYTKALGGMGVASLTSLGLLSEGYPNLGAVVATAGIPASFAYGLGRRVRNTRRALAAASPHIQAAGHITGLLTWDFRPEKKADTAPL